MALIDFIWLICGIFNFAVLSIHTVKLTKMHNTGISWGWFSYFTLFAFILGPMWTLGIILYYLFYREDNYDRLS